jgi:hypothetical protein
MSLYLNGKDLLQYIGEDQTKVIFRSLFTEQFSVITRQSFAIGNFKKIDFDPYKGTTGLQELTEQKIAYELMDVFPLYVISVGIGSGFINYFFKGTELLPYFNRGYLFPGNFSYPMKQLDISYKVGDLERVHWIYVPISSTNNVIKLNMFSKV